MEERTLAGAPLFRGLSMEEIEQVLPLLRAKTRSYGKNASIFHAGDTVSQMGLVLSGGVRVEHDDAWGGKSLFSHIGPGGMFGETYACLPGQPMLVTAVASAPSSILLLSPAPLLAAGDVSGVLGRVASNLLRVAMRKNLELSRRILHTTPKTIRGRLLSYLSEQALLSGGERFTIPFNRQQLADYLGVDRSALSHELSKMSRDGLLYVQRSTFLLHSEGKGQACNPRQNPVE